MKLSAISKWILGLLLVSNDGTLLASDAEELRERAKAMEAKAAVLFEEGNEEDGRRLKKESAELLEMAERLQTKPGEKRARVEKETMQLKERLQNLIDKERILLEEQADESKLQMVRAEISELEHALHQLRRHSAEHPEHRPEFRAQMEKLERAGRRLHHLRVAAEHLKLAEEHDLAVKIMEKADDIGRDVHSAKRRLAAEMEASQMKAAEARADRERHTPDQHEFIEKLKEENERLKAELRELKQNAESR